MRHRVLIVTPEFPPQTGGIGTHCYEMANQWSRSADVTVVVPAVPEPRPATPFRVVEVDRSGTRLGRVVRTTLAVRRALRETRPTAVYSAHWRACGVPLLFAGLAWRRRIRMSQAFHGSEILTLLRGGRRNGLLRLLFEWTQRRADLLGALGSYQAVILEDLGVTRERMYICPEGVDLARFATVDPAVVQALRERLGLADRRVLMTVGRIVERKGHDMVIRALPSVLERVPDAVYVIVGGGPHETRLREIVDQIGVGDRTIFTGRVADDELLAAYALCDVFVMASREVDGDIEGFGIAFAEAAALSKPCVGGNSGGVSEAVADGVSGLLVDPLDPEAIAEAVTRLLLDPELAQSMGRAGRERVVADLQYEKIAAGLLAAVTGDSVAEAAESQRRGVRPRLREEQV